jgi:hypothetical protein
MQLSRFRFPQLAASMILETVCSRGLARGVTNRYAPYNSKGISPRFRQGSRHLGQKCRSIGFYRQLWYTEAAWFLSMVHVDVALNSLELRSTTPSDSRWGA